MFIIAVNSYGIGALFIKLFTFSKWNHVAICFDNIVIDSVGFHGVRKTRLEDFLKKYPNHELIDPVVPNPNKAKTFALEQVGKPYDRTALFGIVFQRNWHNPNKWFCSELVEAVLEAGGRKRFRSSVSSILPRETYSVI